MHGQLRAVVALVLVAVIAGCAQPSNSPDEEPSASAGASSTPSSSAAPEPGGDRMAYVAQVAGIDQLFVLEPDGRAHQVSQHDAEFGGLVHGPRWSPDGSRIAFGVGFPPLFTWVVNADGSDLRQVSSAGILGPWSPDGRHILVSEFNDVVMPGQQLLTRMVNVDDGSEEVVTDGSPIAWLADGRIGLRRFAMQGTAISILDVETGDETYLLNADDAAWSPDGTQIAFTRHTPCPPEPCAMLGVANADGTNATELTIGQQPVWSPDGERLAYIETIGSGPQQNLRLMTADGEPIQTAAISVAGPIGWSPDGSRLGVTAGDMTVQPYDLVIFEVGGEATTIGQGLFGGFAPAQ